MNRPGHQASLRFCLLLLLVIPGSAVAQQDTTLLRRWVGNYLEKPLTLEFYGDTMLVVGDRYALDYRMTPESLLAVGDTSVVARWRIARDRLLLEIPDGNVITMATQKTLGRPLTGRWVGDVDTSGALIPIELHINADRTACWHSTPDGKWTTGEWDRQTRLVTLTWDNSEWTGLYDPQRNSLLLEPMADSTRTATGPTGILRRIFRGTGPALPCPR